MGNKVKYNLKNVHAAKLTKDSEDRFIYATPRRFPAQSASAWRLRATARPSMRTASYTSALRPTTDTAETWRLRSFPNGSERKF